MDALREDYGVSAICQAVAMSRSSYYRKPVERAGAHRIEEAIAHVAAEHPGYGSRRISAQLRLAPYKLVVNRKRAQRVMRQRGLLIKPRRSKSGVRGVRHGLPRFPNLMKGLLVTRPNLGKHSVSCRGVSPKRPKENRWRSARLSGSRRH